MSLYVFNFNIQDIFLIFIMVIFCLLWQEVDGFKIFICFIWENYILNDERLDYKLDYKF